MKAAACPRCGFTTRVTGPGITRRVKPSGGGVARRGCAPTCSRLRVLQGVEAVVVGVYEISVSGRHLERHGGQLTEDVSATIHRGHGDDCSAWGGANRLGRVAPVDPESGRGEATTHWQGRGPAQANHGEVLKPGERNQITVNQGVSASPQGFPPWAVSTGSRICRQANPSPPLSSSAPLPRTKALRSTARGPRASAALTTPRLHILPAVAAVGEAPEQVVAGAVGGGQQANPPTMTTADVE